MAVSTPPHTDGLTGYFISAPWRSSGKTIFSLGLAREAYRRALAVQTFKKGPDFIDPLWLAAASGTGCYNLDPYIQQGNQWQSTFSENLTSQTLALVEGTMGLHDGLQVDGSDSNASVARALGLPVILVVDCRGMHRTIAALVNGITQFDASVEFAGLVLNRIRSTRHESKVRAALEQYSDIKLLGAIPESTAVHIDEKQLGLTPVVEAERTNRCIDAAADLVAIHCDLDHLFRGVDSVPDTASTISELRVRPEKQAFSGIKIGIARDEAFHFYYQDDLDAFVKKGVDIIELSPMGGSFPADLDGLLIGGGFPERHARALAANKPFLDELRHAIQGGLAVHAECAGLMYLCNRLVLDDGCFDMVGAIEGDVHMCKKPQGRGYMKLINRHNRTEIRAHEFHHSRISFDKPQQYLFDVARGQGLDGTVDGVRVENVHASFAHIRHTAENPWIDYFLQRVIDARTSALQVQGTI